MKIFKILIAAIFFTLNPLTANQEILKKEGEAILEKCLKIAAEFYHLEEGDELREITSEILNSHETQDSIKELIRKTDRRFFLFKYPSDGFKVYGYISFVPDPSGNPLLLFLRGGNRIFGLMHPATELSCLRNYTVIATTYRGGVSEGVDEFGGAEVSDVNHLFRYMPTLEEKLNFSFDPENVFMLGGSRGGMEMFLALSRSPDLQYQINKAASLSGILDINEYICSREGQKQMFIRDFGLVPLENEEEWVKLRNPIDAVPLIRKDLPFLILQGTNDLRVSLDQGRHMALKLKENGNPVTYLEIPGGDHCLRNFPERMNLIADWFEE